MSDGEFRRKADKRGEACPAFIHKTRLKMWEEIPEMRTKDLNRQQYPSPAGGLNRKTTWNAPCFCASPPYSERSDFTGLDSAARRLCTEIVRSAISSRISGGNRKINHESFM
jgi:hypothetical protein